MRPTKGLISLSILAIMLAPNLVTKFGDFTALFILFIPLGFVLGKFYQRWVPCNESKPVFPESEKLEVQVELCPESQPRCDILHAKGKRFDQAFIQRMLISGKFKWSFEIIESYHWETGSHYKVLHVLEAKTYQVKVIPISMDDDQVQHERSFREVDSTLKLNSKYVLRYVTSWFEEIIESGEKTINLYIQSEDSEGITLKELLNTRILNPSEKVYIFNQLIRAIDYIHHNSVIHRNLNPTSIFIENQCDIKIGNFQLAKCGVETNTLLRTNSYNNSTIWKNWVYFDPQISNNFDGGFVDYFSFGMICLEMWLDETDEFARARELSKFRSAMTLPDAFLARHPYASKLILNLSATEPLKRPTANEILHSRALNEWNRETINNTN